jgi:hypothetical protein
VRPAAHRWAPRTTIATVRPSERPAWSLSFGVQEAPRVALALLAAHRINPREVTLVSHQASAVLLELVAVALLRTTGHACRDPNPSDSQHNAGIQSYENQIRIVVISKCLTSESLNRKPRAVIAGRDASKPVMTPFEVFGRTVSIRCC